MANYLLYSLSKLAYVFLILTSCAVSLTAQQSPVDFELDNGLSVSLRPASSAKLCALVVLYDFGNLCDPAGKSGMAHYAEHLYCTGATAKTESRTAEEFFRAFKHGANAQTGDRYTVFAAMFEAEQLDDVLSDAADRMRKIHVSEQDLEREIPRLNLELENMFGGIPALAVTNLNKQLRLPAPHGGLRGGRIEELKKVSVNDLQSWLDRFYKPNNARLIVVGPLDVEQKQKQITELFQDIPSGESPLINNVLAFDQPLENREQTIEYSSRMPEKPTMVALTFAAPSPADEQFAGFLLLAKRIQMSADKLGAKKNSFPVNFTPLDLPEFLSVSVDVESEETPQETAQRLRDYVSECISGPLEKNEAAGVQQVYGTFYNLHKNPERFFLFNVYGWAFMIGRTQQMHVDPPKLIEQLNSLDDSQMESARLIFAPDKTALTILKPKSE